MARPSTATRPCVAFASARKPEGFVFESLPGYAPDLNPLDTGVWHHLKDVALANVCCRDLPELREVLTTAITYQRSCKTDPVALVES